MERSHIIKDNRMDLTTCFFVIFLASISFFTEPIQDVNHVFIKIFLGVLFLRAFLESTSLTFFSNRKNLPLLIFLLAISGNVFFAQNKNVAVVTYLDISLNLVFLYYLVSVLSSSEKHLTIIIRSISIFSFLVILLGITEPLIAKTKIGLLYQRINDPYYLMYRKLGPTSTQFHPTVLGSFLLGCLPFNFLLFKDKNALMKFFGGACVILNAALIILTFSRCAFLGLVGAIVFYLLTKKKNKAITQFLAVVVLFIAICSQPYSVGKGFNKLGIKAMIYGNKNQALLSNYRVSRLKMAVDIVKDHPFFGIGMQHFRIRFKDYYRGDADKVHNDRRTADNMYLTLLAETGMVGFLGFLIFVFYLFREGMAVFRKIKDKYRKDILAVSMSGLAGLLIAMAGYEFFYWHAPLSLFCIICGMISGQISVKECS